MRTNGAPLNFLTDGIALFAFFYQLDAMCGNAMIKERMARIAAIAVSSLQSIETQKSGVRGISFGILRSSNISRIS